MVEEKRSVIKMCCVLGYAGHDLSKEKFTEYLMRTASRGPDDQRVAET